MRTHLPIEAISVLVVDDDISVLNSWREILRGPQYQVSLICKPEEAQDYLDTKNIDVAVVDIRMPSIDGMTLLSTIKSRRPEIEVIMMTGYGGIQDAVEAIKKGAYDFLSKPFESIEAAELTIRRAAERRLLERHLQKLEREKQDDLALRGIVGQSKSIRKMMELIRSVATSSATVLIWGESGTGKELVAKALHDNSQRRMKPLIAVNCSALTETLLENELFGHTKGAYTGATSNQQGLFEAANGGTIFLDEIGDMAPSTQVKLLRTLQEGEIRPVGSTRTVHVDVRVIAATNVDLEQKCRENSFRQDLFYRLNVVRIDVPPLRERVDDIPLLAHHFLQKYQNRSQKQFEGIDANALDCLIQYHWPGNVRELENIIERAVVLSRKGSISINDLPETLVTPFKTQQNCNSQEIENEELTSLTFPKAKEIAVTTFERKYLTRLLAQYPNISAAAQAAGLDRSNFKRLLRRHGL